MLARAKSTARAEARRRHRASQVTTGTDPNELSDEAAPNQLGAGAAPQRRGLLGFTMPDWRGDIRAFPHELRTNRWWWISTLLLLSAPVAAAVGVNLEAQAGQPLELYYRLMVSPPAIPVLVAGFMSRRGPYLIGLILGAIDGIIYVGVPTIFATSETVPPPSITVAGWSLVSFALLGAVFAWIAFMYRGWLQNSSKRRIEQREKQAQEQKRKARDEARQGRSGR